MNDNQQKQFVQHNLYMLAAAIYPVIETLEYRKYDDSDEECVIAYDICGKMIARVCITGDDYTAVVNDVLKKFRDVL